MTWCPGFPMSDKTIEVFAAKLSPSRTGPCNSATMTLEINMRHICRFATKPDVKQLPDSAVTKAFGNRASGKCVQQLRSAELAVRCQALLAAVQLLAQTGTYVQCLTAEMPAALTDLLKVRLCANHCLSTCNTELLTRSSYQCALALASAGLCDVQEPAYLQCCSASMPNFLAAPSICRGFSLAACLCADVLYRNIRLTSLQCRCNALLL